MIKKINFNPEPIFEALQWHDNCKEMKRFCGEDCTITYESCAIDDYWLLTVNDVIVPLWDYVVKTSDGKFFIISPFEYEKYFKEIE